MYGMVNNAVRELVVSRFGDRAWEQIRAEAGLEIESFLANDGYDDRVTYDLVAAATRILGIPAESILEAFGEWWVLETAEKSYAEMMAVAGTSLGEFLDNLPNFHARVSLLFPSLQPPEFAISNREETGCVLHYHSHREGLQHFVIGLVRGLGKRFGTEVDIRLGEGRHSGLDHDEFLIRWTPAPGVP